MVVPMDKLRLAVSLFGVFLEVHVVDLAPQG